MKRKAAFKFVAEEAEEVNQEEEGKAAAGVTAQEGGGGGGGGERGKNSGNSSSSSGFITMPVAHRPTITEDATYTVENFKVINELDTPVWLYDPDGKRNLWANDAAIKLYEKASIKEFLSINFQPGGGGDEMKRFGSSGGSPGCASSSSVRYANFCDTARDVIEGKGDRELQGHLPGLKSDSPHCECLFSISFKKISVLWPENAKEPQVVCLVSTESARLFDSVYQSLRALEMLKACPIFSFLFTCEGKLLTANPCAFTFYREYLGHEEGLTLKEILSVGDWGDSVTYPDENGPELDGIEGISKKIDKLCEHIHHTLFVEKFESFRIQIRMPKRQDPGKFRWAEFEMWAAEDPVTKRHAILVNQTNQQETKKLELELKDKHQQLQSQNKKLRVELIQEKMKKPKGFIDLDSTVDKTVSLLDDVMAGKQPSQADILYLKEALTTRDLRAPNRLEEVLLSNKKGFEGEVGLSLFEMLKGGAKNPHDESILPMNSMRDMTFSRNNSSARKYAKSLNDIDALGEVAGGSNVFPPPQMNSGREDFIVRDREAEDFDKVPERIEFSRAELEFLETVDDWFFDAFELDKITGGHPLRVLSCFLFKRLNLLETYNISEKTFYLFVDKIERGFPDNAYHNNIHVANVVQSMYILLTRGLGPKVAGDKEIMAGMLAAIIHDYEHKGVNNDFLVRFQDELAMKYNDSSPLENHHIAAAFSVMVQKPYDIFSNTSVDKFTLVRKQIIEMVLATDMKLHFNILGRFRLIEKKLFNWNENNDNGNGAEEGEDCDAPPSPSPSSMPPEDISLALQLCLKCADIGHVYCLSNVHLKWVQKLEQEFFAQGDREEELGARTKSPLMDRDKAGITKSQCGFFQLVVVPLFKSFSSAFPSIEPVMEQLNKNLELWQKIEEEQLEISEVFL